MRLVFWLIMSALLALPASAAVHPSSPPRYLVLAMSSTTATYAMRASAASRVIRRSNTTRAEQEAAKRVLARSLALLAMGTSASQVTAVQSRTEWMLTPESDGWFKLRPLPFLALIVAVLVGSIVLAGGKRLKEGS
jgi:hypothetical protein